MRCDQAAGRVRPAPDPGGESARPVSHTALQLQVLWVIPTAAVSENVFGRRLVLELDEHEKRQLW